MNEFPTYNDPYSYFKLRPLKAAKVSEISESTATSPVKPEERVNFHIGNPIQDIRLSSLYSQLVLELEIPVNQVNLNKISEDYDWNSKQVEQIKLICRAIENSSPYMPRVGFNFNNPNQHAILFKDWLIHHQYEPLEYDLGTETGRREIIFSCGGIWENLRVLFFSLTNYMLNLPARVFLSGVQIPDFLFDFPSLLINKLNRHIKSVEYELNKLGKD